MRYGNLQNDKSQRAALQALIDAAESGPASNAEDVIVTPAGGISATDVQAALEELDTEKQGADATLTALAGLDSSAGLVEQTGVDTFAKRALGVGASTSVPTRADADTRYAAASHTHAQSDITSLTSDLAAKAPTSRSLTAGVGLSGGGDLSADRTFTVDLNELTTDATGGATTDYLPFVDVSGSNSSDKVLVSDFITNAGIATLASPALSGNPTAPTASADDNDTSVSTTAFVQQEINDRIRCWQLEIFDPVVGRYTFARAPGFAGTIQSLTHITNQGTVTGDVEIDGTDVTSLTSIGADSSETTTAATAANTFTSGQRIEWNCTAVSGGAQKVTLTLTYKRTGTG